MHHNPEPRQIANHQLARLIELAEESNHLLRINNRLLRLLVLEEAPPVLTTIQIAFSQGVNMAAVAGPITLTAAGQTATASVLGFDQFGQPFTGVMPPATLSSDDTAQAIVTFDPTTGLTTAVADGVANITATLTTAEGVNLSDTEAVTVAIQVTPPVLSSIKVAFDVTPVAAPK